MTEDLSRGTSEDVSEAVESGADMVVSGVEGAEELIGQAAIDVPAPGPNQVDTYQTQPGQVYNLLFPPSDATVKVEGTTYVLEFDNGGRIEFIDFLVAAGGDLPPTMVIGGVELLGSLLVTETLTIAGLQGPSGGPSEFGDAIEAAAAALASGGGSSPPPDINAYPGLLDPQGVIPPRILEFRLPDPEVPKEILLRDELTPPSADDVTTPADRGDLPEQLVGALGTLGLLGGGAVEPALFAIEHNDPGFRSIIKIGLDGSVSVVVTNAEIAAAVGTSDFNLSESGVAVDSAGNIFFTTDEVELGDETDVEFVLVKPADGGPVQVIATNPDVQDPEGIVLGPDGTLYVVDDNMDSIVKITDPLGTPDISILIDKATLEAEAGITTVNLEAGLAISADGETLYVASDGGPNAVFAIDIDSGAVIWTAAGAPFEDLKFVTVAPDGSIIVMDDGDDLVFRISSDGSTVTTFLTTAQIQAANGGVFPDLQGGAAFDADGNFYLTEEITDTILKWDAGSELGTIDTSSGALFVSEETIAAANGGIDNDPDLEGDLTFPVVTGANVAFFKELTVDGIIGDSDISVADFGGKDAETKLSDLEFTLDSLPNYGILILIESDGSTSVMSVGDSFTSADTIYWVAFDSDIAEFGLVPDATFDYTVTDTDGMTADATVVITIDDAPLANPDTDMVVEGGEPTTGNVITGVDGDESPNDGNQQADDSGGDGYGSPKIISVSSDTETKTTSDAVGNEVTLTSSLGGTLTINLLTGAYSYDPPASVDNTEVNPEDVFNYTIQDKDGDTSSTTLTIEIKDGNAPSASPDTDMVVEGSTPTTGNVITGVDGDSSPNDGNQQADDPGGDGFGTPKIVSISSDNDTKTIADAVSNEVTISSSIGGTLVINLQTGAYTYTPPASVDNSGGDPTDQFSYTVQDSDGSQSMTTLTITIKDTGPTANPDTDMVVEGGAATTGNVLTGIDPDASPNDGNQQADTNSQDTPFTIVSVSSDTETMTTTDANADDEVTLTSSIGGSLTIDLVTGFYTYTPPADVDNSGGNPTDQFSYTIEDSDGTPSMTTLTIEIKDANAPSASPDTDMVVEGGTPTTGNVITGVDGDSPPNDGNQQADDPGGDGFGTPKIVAVSSDNDSQTDADAVGSQLTISSSIGGTLVINIVTGAYTYTPPASVDNSGGDPTDQFSYTIQDSDGSQSMTTLTITIKDTGPTANPDTDMVVEGGAATTGNVLTGIDPDASPNDGNQQADTNSQDTPFTMVSVSSDTETKTTADANADDEVTLTSSIGASLTIDLVTGFYTYTPPASVDNSGANPTDQFNYTIEDSDGTQSMTTLTIEIKDGPDPMAGNVTVEVDEDDLPAGIGDEAPGDDLGASAPTLVSGTLDITGGSDSFEVDFSGMTGAVEDSNTNPVTTSTVALFWFWDAASNTLYASTDVTNAATAAATAAFMVVLTDPTTGDFDLTLLGQVDHPIVDTEDNLIIVMDFTVTDSDGDIAAGTLTVDIDDDSPVVISPDSAVVGNTSGSVGTTTEDLNFLVTVGADQPGDLVFDLTGHTDGEALMGSIGGGADVALTSDGFAILLEGFGSDTLTAWADLDGNGIDAGDTKVFEIVLDPSGDSYTIIMSDDIDNGSGENFDDFTQVTAGQQLWTGVNGVNVDILLTAGDADTETANTSTAGFGVSNNLINFGEVARIDFVLDLNLDRGALTKNDFLNGLDTISYSGHETVNGGRVQISGITGGDPADVKVTAYDTDADTGNVAGDYLDDTKDTIIGANIIILDENGMQVTINEVISDTDPVDDPNSVYIVENADGSITVFNMENDWVISSITTSDGFSRLEVENVDTGGESFRITEVGFGDFESGEPIDMDFDLLVTDEDLDTSTGTIDVTVLPAIEGDGGNNTLTSNGDAEFLIGAGGDDTLTGDAGADIFVFSLAADDGDDTITDFIKAEDVLSFTGVTDTGAAGLDVDDVDAAISSFVNGGAGNDVTVNFDNGASITFTGVGTASLIDSIADLVDDPATQIMVS